MHFHDTGRGEAILLIHAFPFDGRMWSSQAAALADRYRVVAPDLPGFGASPSPAGNPTIDDWADALVAWCSGQGIARALVAGCSLGGYVALAMHRRSPAFVAGLSIFDSRAGVDTQDVRRTRYEMVERARHEGIGFLADARPPMSPATISGHPDIVAAARQMTAAATAVGVMAAQRAMASRKDSRPLLGAIRVPTAIVHGMDDPIVPRAEAEAMAAAVRGARFVELEACGHLPPLERPADVTAVLRDLASQCFSPSAASTPAT